MNTGIAVLVLFSMQTWHAAVMVTCLLAFLVTKLSRFVLLKASTLSCWCSFKIDATITTIILAVLILTNAVASWCSLLMVKNSYLQKIACDASLSSLGELILS